MFSVFSAIQTYTLSSTQYGHGYGESQDQLRQEKHGSTQNKHGSVQGIFPVHTIKLLLQQEQKSNYI